MRVLYTTTEMVPLVATGGLGDIASSLPIALNEKGCDTRIILPAYAQVKGQVKNCRVIQDMGDPLGVGHFYIAQTTLENGIELYLACCDELFDRCGGPYQDEQGYDYQDNMFRFAAFSYMVAWFSTHAENEWTPDLLHLNDWQTGLVPAYLKTWHIDMPCIYTIHNLKYQGIFPADNYHQLGLAPELFNMHQLEFYGKLNFAKAGITLSDRVTTVSKTYAEEIQTPEYGFGLDSVIRTRKPHLSGIVNGLDPNVWDPLKDDLVDVHYSTRSLYRKRKNKMTLQKMMGLTVDKDIPVLGVVSRIVEQKGLDVLLSALEFLLPGQDIQFVIVGTGEQYLEHGYAELAAVYPEKMSVFLQYDYAMAHRFQSSIDMLVVPSRFEPCGLSQLQGLRYGSVPIVHATGGLADTVNDSNVLNEQTGFSFDELSVDSIINTVERALSVYRFPEKWARIQKNGMKKDFSWQYSARSYIDLYADISEQTTQLKHAI